MTNEKRDHIDASATDNAGKGWQKNLNPYDPRSVEHHRYNDTYKSAGGRN